MLKKPVKMILFFSSYLPLFIIFIIKDSFGNFWINTMLGITSLISIAVLFLFIKKSKQLEGNYVHLVNVISRDNDATSYIVSYIIPFLSLDLNKFTDKFSLLILFIVIAVIYTNSNMIHINPVLNFIGYHIYEIEDMDGNRLILLTKKIIVSTKKKVIAVNLSGSVYLEEE